MSLFATPNILWLLLILVAPLCVFMFWSWRTKQKLIAQFVQSRLLANLTVGVSQSRQKLRLTLLVAAVLFLVLAMARPQWGFSWEEAKQQGLDIVVAIDTSRSMLAEDLAPNRLTRAKLAALDLMRLSKSDRLGLVAFAGSAFLQCPLTLDEEAFRQSVEALDVGIIPQGGTALTEAIESALTGFDKGDDNHKILVLFTDGEDHDSGALAAAEKAAKAGLKIFTIGVGTAEGELIRVRDEQGNVGFLKDDSGNAVKSRLNETLLQKIATAGNGFYLPLRGANPMETLYAKGLAPLPKSDSTTKLIRRYRERYHWPLSIAILLLLLELFLPQRKRAERNSQNHSNRVATAFATVAALMLGFSSHASPSSALREYDSGNFHTALEEFKRLSREKTNDLRLAYNAGAAAYRAKQFEDAEKFFGQATTSPNLELQQQAYYNLGNTFYSEGEQILEPDKKQAAWEDSAKNFEYALKLNPKDGDAKSNLEFVRKKLEELKQQQQQQQKQNSKNDPSKENDKNQNQDQQQKEEKKDSESQEQNSQKEQQQSEQEKKQTHEKDSQQKQNQQQQKEQPGNENQNASKPDEKKDGEQQAVALGQMTPEQARQFLDAQKQEDKALIFAPPKDPKNRSFKDW